MKISFNPQIKTKNLNPICKVGVSPIKIFQNKDVCAFGSIKINQSELEKKYAKLFDEVYDEVIFYHLEEYCPEIAQIKLNKPKFEVIQDEKFKNIDASYCIVDNSIQIPKHILEDDYYVCLIAKNSQTEDLTCTGAFCETILPEKLEKIKEKYSDYELIKLTNEEKELYISAIMAHEIRHFLQKHLMLSTKGVSEKAKKRWGGINKQVLFLQKMFDKITSQNNKIENKPYFETYKPLKLLDKNTKIKYSLYSENEQMFAIKDFLKSENYIAKNRQKLKEKDIDYSYCADLEEIDAHNFAYEYSLTKVVEKMDNIRPNVVLGASFWQKSQAELGLKYLKENHFFNK